jgi:hypothetical protein
MKPVTVSIAVDRPQDEVFAFLDVLGNHRPFTDHVLTDWTLSGPEVGVGAKAHLFTKGPGPKQEVDMEVISSDAPVSTVERSISAGGRRRTTGTYTLAPADDGGTLVRFDFRWEEAPLGDRLAAPLVRATLKRANERAMVRLKALLER